MLVIQLKLITHKNFENNITSKIIVIASSKLSCVYYVFLIVHMSCLLLRLKSNELKIFNPKQTSVNTLINDWWSMRAANTQSSLKKTSANYLSAILQKVKLIYINNHQVGLVYPLNLNTSYFCWMAPKCILYSILWIAISIDNL